MWPITSEIHVPSKGCSNFLHKMPMKSLISTSWAAACLFSQLHIFRFPIRMTWITRGIQAMSMNALFTCTMPWRVYFFRLDCASLVPIASFPHTVDLLSNPCHVLGCSLYILPSDNALLRRPCLFQSCISFEPVACLPHWFSFNQCMFLMANMN